LDQGGSFSSIDGREMATATLIVPAERERALSRA
jgi:hypothetical protein